MNNLKPPEEYLIDMENLRKHNKYAKNWALELKKHTNRHPDSQGRSWGWYSIFPLDITVGYWGHGQDELKGIDVGLWNEKAKEIS